jgi:hypothetical protein
LFEKKHMISSPTPHSTTPGVVGTNHRSRLVRRLVAGLVVALLVLGLLHGLVWRWTTRQLQTEFALAMEQRRALGWTVRHGTPVRGGWPVSAQLTVPDLVMSYDGADLPGGLSWSTRKLLLTIVPLHPRSLRLGVEGQQALRLAGLPEIPFTADRFVLSVALEPGVPPRDFVLDVEDLRAGIPIGGTNAALEIASLHGRAETRPAAAQGEPVATFSADAAGVALPQPTGTTWPLGRTIPSLSVEGAFNGPWPRPSAAVSLAQRIAFWRDGGGSLEIRRLAAIWGPLDLSTTATLALDEQMQPMGAANAKVTGHAETLDALAAGHVITPGTARTAKVLLSLMARVPEGGGAPMVEVPLTLQQRGLDMGRIPLARLPVLVWPN